MFWKSSSEWFWLYQNAQTPNVAKLEGVIVQFGIIAVDEASVIRSDVFQLFSLCRECMYIGEKAVATFSHNLVYRLPQTPRSRARNACCLGWRSETPAAASERAAV